MKLNSKKGFTLIELLVVIAIIGILSSVVLASLTTARSKGTDAAIGADLANMRAQAELYYSNNNNYGPAYNGVCPNAVAATGMFATTTTNAGSLLNLSTDVAAKAVGGQTKTVCMVIGGISSGSQTWAAVASTTSGSYCVDSSGNSGTAKVNPGTTGICS